MAVVVGFRQVQVAPLPAAPVGASRREGAQEFPGDKARVGDRPVVATRLGRKTNFLMLVHT